MSLEPVVQTFGIEVYDGSEDSVLKLENIQGYLYRLQTLDHPDGEYMFTIWTKCLADMSLRINVLGLERSFDLHPSDGWVRLEMRNTDPNYPYVEFITVYADDNSGNNVLYLYKAMLELSNHVSDWRPAPEDFENELQEVNRRIEHTYTKLFHELDDSIESIVAEKTLTFENDVQTAREEFATTVQQFSDNITTTISRIEEAAGSLAESATWQRFDEEGIHIGKIENGQQNGLTMDLSNEQLTFKKDNVPLSYINGQAMYIKQAEILNTLRFGDFAFMPTASGMALIYVGQ